MSINEQDKLKKKRTHLLSMLLEMSFIIFLFYANLLMGEFERSGSGAAKGLQWALHDIFTTRSIFIAILAAFIGHFIFDFFRNKL
jgi:hypothetical protein